MKKLNIINQNHDIYYFYVTLTKFSLANYLYKILIFGYLVEQNINILRY